MLLYIDFLDFIQDHQNNRFSLFEGKKKCSDSKSFSV